MSRWLSLELCETSFLSAMSCFSVGEKVILNGKMGFLSAKLQTDSFPSLILIFERMCCGIWHFFGITPGVVVFVSEGTRLASWKQLWEYIPWLLLSIGIGSFCIPPSCVEKNSHKEHVTWCEKIRWKIKYPLCTVVCHKGSRRRHGRSLSLLLAYFTVFTEMELVVTHMEARGFFLSSGANGLSQLTL